MRTIKRIGDLPQNYWNFIEHYLPNYHIRDDVFNNDILHKYINRELDYRNNDDLADINFIVQKYKDPDKEYEKQVVNFFKEAVEAAYKILENEKSN